MLTAKETANLPETHEIPEARMLTYTLPNGRKDADTFTEYERCPMCTRNQPTEHMQAHMGWEHG